MGPKRLSENNLAIGKNSVNIAVVSPAGGVAGFSRFANFTSDYRQLETLTDLLKAKYDFRPNARGFNKRVSTWVDQDDSGNYDPSCDKPEPEPIINTKRKRESVYRTDRQEDGRAPKKPKTITWQLGRQIGLVSPVTLRLTSESGRALLRKLSVFPDNWPQPVSDSAEDSDPFTSSWSASRNSFSTNLTSQTSQSYLLRSQSRPAFSGRSLSNSSPSLLNFGDLTLGHPAARGCKPCLELRQVCPLLSEGSTYPCEYCVEDDLECELVIPPAKKRACEGCQSRRFRCSYREGGDHSLPCAQCVQLNYKCVAGPKSGRVRTGPSLDQDFNRSTSRRAFVTCTSCRKEKRWCSLKDKTKEPPCTYCRKTGNTCTFEKLDETTKLKSKALTTQPNNNHQPSEAAPIDPQPTIKTITTRYAHPIAFNYEPPDDDSSPCHFCQHIAYGILGLGPQTVTVRVPDQYDASSSSSGYIELSNGHRADGHEPTRMCVSCTTARLRILFCPADPQHQHQQQHLIRPIPDSDPEAFDFDAAFAGLIPSLTTSSPPTTETQTQWCSVCSSPAFFHCRAPQTIDSYGLPVAPDSDSPDAVGCGLLLCEACAVALTGECGGDLEALVKAAVVEEMGDGDGDGDEEGEGEGLRVRADAGFLLRGGDLMRGVFGVGVGVGIGGERVGEADGG